MFLNKKKKFPHTNAADDRDSLTVLESRTEYTRISKDLEKSRFNPQIDSKDNCRFRMFTVP